VLTYVLGPFLALVPERWRKQWFEELPIQWSQAALLSGLLEAVGFLIALVWWYFHFTGAFAGEQAKDMVAKDILPGGTQQLGFGAVNLIWFAIQPITLVLEFFAAEGVVRALAALSSGETFGTAPLAIFSALIADYQRRAYERRVPLVPDLVTRSIGQHPWDLKVQSCRPKPEWKFPKTLTYENQFYQVMKEVPPAGSAARPHVYFLRVSPPGVAFRGFEDYDPLAVTRVPGQESGGFFQLMIGSALQAWRIRRLPLVEDRVITGDGKQGWHLRVESCRPKPHWKYPRTISYKERLFRVESEYQSSEPRPFGYNLKLLPPNEAARGVLAYSPDEPLHNA